MSAARTPDLLLAVPATRKAIGALIDRLIEAMDAIDGDADCEDNGDAEPCVTDAPHDDEGEAEHGYLHCLPPQYAGADQTERPLGYLQLREFGPHGG